MPKSLAALAASIFILLGVNPISFIGIFANVSLGFVKLFNRLLPLTIAVGVATLDIRSDTSGSTPVSCSTPDPAPMLLPVPISLANLVNKDLPPPRIAFPAAFTPGQLGRGKLAVAPPNSPALYRIFPKLSLSLGFMASKASIPLLADLAMNSADCGRIGATTPGATSITPAPN